MSLKLITGASGGAHVTSADAGAFNCGLYDEEKGYILPTGRQFDIDLITSDTVRIYDGDVVFQGRHCRIENGAFVDINIPPCPAGSTRFDVIAIRYTLDTGSGTESVEFVLKQGTLDESLSFAEKLEAIMNMTVVGSIPSGDQTVDLPVFIIYHEGTNIVNYGKTLPVAKSIIDVDKRVDNILDEQLMVPIIVQHGEAGYYFENEFHPFVDAPEFDFLGTITMNTTTARTMELSGNISDYKYLLFGGCPFSAQTGTIPSSLAQSTNIIISTYRLKEQPAIIYYGAGSSGSITMLNCTVTYVNDSAVTLKNSGNPSRTWYMYGIK